jgi:hypothetical protein
MQIQIENEQVKIPQEFTKFLHKKLKKNVKGGRPSFISQLSKDRDAQEEILNITELAWIKNKGLTTIAKKYGTTKDSIWRLLRDLTPLQEVLTTYLLNTPRRKRFYIPDLDWSDYETIQNYIRRAKREGLKRYKDNIKVAEKVWKALKYKDPSNWTCDEVADFLSTITPGMRCRTLDGVRQVAPQIRDQTSKDYLGTGRYRELLKRRKKDIFGSEVEMIHKALTMFKYYKTIFDLHITLGAREGSTDKKHLAGMVGLSWDSFNNNFMEVDLYESKVRGGITWKDCPLDLFFKDLPKRLHDLWVERGKPTTEKILKRGYDELTEIYKAIRKILKNYYEGKIDPKLLKEFTSLRPHDANKIHVNLLWEAKVPLEVVAGDYLGQGEGLGLMGRGWLDINTIKKYYLSLTRRSERFQDLRQQVHNYSERFNGAAHNRLVIPLCVEVKRHHH